ncbi:MAG: hypothetical protein M3680_27565, partial [Myxococcota bacterium]|nr:hypothetical protein [Myxococcota bacterium]
MRIRDGRVVETISYFDQYEMFQQLGVLPPADQLATRHDQDASRRVGSDAAWRDELPGAAAPAPGRRAGGVGARGDRQPPPAA